MATIIYFYAEDEKYYSDKAIEELKLKNKLSLEIKKLFTKEDIEKEVIVALKENKNSYILTPIYFNSVIQEYQAFIKVVRLQNHNGILTSQDIRLKIKAEDKLKIKLNSSITKPTVTFENYGGAKDLVDETNIINDLFHLGIPVKGIFLTGIPGTGKSFFAKCLAGQLNRYLIELNLTKFMKSENSILLIEEFFDFFKTNPGDYIIWIDEIEKMFVGDEESTQLLGTLLTKINDFNSSSGKSKSTAFIVATANNVYSLSQRNPEFFRNGRFDILIALNPPTAKGAEEICEMYTKMNQKSNFEIISNAIFLEFIKLRRTPEKPKSIKKGLLSIISHYVKINKDSIDGFLLEYSIKDKKKFYKVLTEIDTYFTQSVKKDFSSYVFTFNIKQTISQVFSEHRTKCENQHRFPYVPAEIEYLVTSFYKHYLFEDIEITDETIKLYVEKIKPIQASMKEQITEMNGVISDFRQI